MSIEKELIKATKLRVKAKEEPGEWRERLARACAEENMAEEVWAELSGDAQDWANGALQAIKAKKDVPEFPDAEPEPEPEPEEPEPEPEPEEPEPEPEPEEDEPEPEPDPRPKAKRRGRPKTKVKTEPKGEKKKKNPHALFRELCIELHDKTKEEVMEAAEKAGIKLADTTVTAALYHTDQTITMLRDFGWDVPAPRPKKPSKNS